ncbi:MAG: hypothetical protein FWF51_10365 [Chitinivibrionia bacterium]|nr:hypothetical protein [Chitinivibrionia bacterium]
MPLESKILTMETLDIEIAQLENSKFEYPKKLSEVKNTIAKKERDLSFAKENLEKLQREISSANIDLETHKKELAKSYERLNTVKNNKEYDAVQKEIRERKSLIEDTNRDIAKLKEKLPQVEDNFKNAQESFEKIETENTPLVEDLTQKIAAIDGNITTKTAEKHNLASQISANLMKLYNLILFGRKKSGKALSHISAGSKVCSYCGQILSPNVVKKIMTSANPVVCENCGSLFVLIENQKPLDSEA